MDSETQPVLVPGTPLLRSFPLARYRSPQLSGVVRQMLGSVTEPGDLALAINVSGGTPVAEALASGARLLVLNRNPVERLCIHTDLDPVPLDELQAALTQLGDLRKGDRPLQSYILDQYQTLCPSCQAQGIAEWFAWDREAGEPFLKRVRCPKCGSAQEGPVDEQDIASAGEYPARTTPAYHLALSRLARPDQPIHAAAAELVRLYTERNLASLMDILNRLPQLRLSPPVMNLLAALILDALDLGSNLSAYGAPHERVRMLRTPQRFLERNVWLLLERALDTYTALHRSREEIASPPSPQPVATAAAESLPALLARTDAQYLLLKHSARELNADQLRSAVRALIVEIRPPDATWWALSVMWATWLWGEEATEELHGFLRRRRLDWDWYRRGLALALAALRPLLTPEVPVLAMASTADTAIVRAVVHATNEAGLTIERWISCASYGYRFALRLGERASVGKPPAGSREPDATERGCALLRLRGEPTRHADLEAASVIESRDPDLAQIDPQRSDRLITVRGHRLWLQSPTRAERPLADRVEAHTLQLLLEKETWEHTALIGSLYDQFHGPLSPDPELVLACIDAYATESSPGDVILREEDQPARRRQEVEQLKDQVAVLGKQLAYDVARRRNGDIVWREEGQQRYLFRCSTTAILGPHLLNPPACDGRRCLIIPGGRAALVALKLRRDPRLQELTEADNWSFIKFRHLRRMVNEIRDRPDIEVYLGLDPIVEKESAQLVLPLHIETQQ